MNDVVWLLYEWVSDEDCGEKEAPGGNTDYCHVGSVNVFATIDAAKSAA